jgi:cell shape-determining protein MreC
LHPFISGMPWVPICVATGLGWLVGGKFHSGNLKKKLNLKFQKEQKALYTQYYNDVYTLKEQNTQLVKALEKMGVTVR